tara:strand:+ start:296 stop:2170 length:1875 start_codon:yes stop_codon:yes gene_type:complete
MQNFLSKISSPKDLRKLKKSDLKHVVSEVRNFIIDSVSENGGHFGASLGVVELTVALHYVFNTPKDLLVWDVGHQAYGHKILTGRKKRFNTNRKLKGLSGFPKRSESEYDTFGVGHSSTSIGAALGMAIASKLKKQKKQHIAVIGDGAIGGGMAFEALNHAGIENSNILIILNDNCMSIDPNVGALKDYLLKISTSNIYNNAKSEIWDLLSSFSQFGNSAKKIVKRVEKSIKSTLLNDSNFFESLNFRYFGPIDGHNVEKLVETLEKLKKIKGPKILHCLTVKGKGYELAEKDQTKWHAPGIFDKESGTVVKNKTTVKKYQEIFGEAIVELAKKNKKIVGITPAMPSGSSLKIMMEKIPSRSFDVGIAEQHAVTFAAGLATQGMVPFCNIYSTFLQRAYDQIIHDVALQNLPVIFCIDRAGLVGPDGHTHQGAFDIAFMRCIPNIIITAPMNEIDLRNLMYTAQLQNKHPFSIRYPRGKSVGLKISQKFKKLTIGKGRELNKGKKIACISIGHIGNEVQNVINKLEDEKIKVGHYNLIFIKPLDEVMLDNIAKSYEHLITIEDGCITGGAGTAILEYFSSKGIQKNILRLGIPDKFIPHGTQKEQQKISGIDSFSIEQNIRDLL